LFFAVTDALLIALIAVLLGTGVLALYAAGRIRKDLDRRFTNVIQRLPGAGTLESIHSNYQKMSGTLEQLIRRVEALEERIVPAAELRELFSGVTERIERRTATIYPGKQSIEQRTRRAVAQDFHALLSLHSSLPLRAESLMLSGWAASPETILHLTTLVARLPKDAVVVEFGSGLSTVWMAAAALRESRGIHIISIDHDSRWGADTAAALERLGLRDAAEVRIGPLEPLPGAEKADAPWYALGALEGLDNIHLLVVDGPPRGTGLNARYPAVLHLKDRLVAGATIVLDDTDRQEERAIAQRWIEEFDADRDAVIERVLDRTTVIRLRDAKH
jgi:precorrin-6B methylase 2